VLCHETGVKNGLLVVEPEFANTAEIVSDKADDLAHIGLFDELVIVGIPNIVHRRNTVRKHECIRIVLA
jgi:hypothetical protein